MQGTGIQKNFFEITTGTRKEELREMEGGEEPRLQSEW